MRVIRPPLPVPGRPSGCRSHIKAQQRGSASRVSANAQTIVIGAGIFWPGLAGAAAAAGGPAGSRRSWVNAQPSRVQPREPPRPQRAAPAFMYVGSFTSAARGHGEGVSVYRRNRESGTWVQIQVLKDLADPSFLIVDRQGRCLYSAHGDGTQATAYQIDQATGRLSVLNQQSTGGSNGVHLAIDATNRFLAVANYATGGLAVLPINAGWVARSAQRSGHADRNSRPAPDAAGELASPPLSLRPHRALHRRPRQGARQGLRLPARYDARQTRGRRSLPTSPRAPARRRVTSTSIRVNRMRT